VPASPTIPRPSARETTESDEPIIVFAALKTTDVRLRKVVVPAPDPTRTTLLDYAAFVLDQEAKYCQQ
jgi:hypothetical protein